MHSLIIVTVLQIPTLYIYNKLLNVKYRLMEAKRIEIFILLRSDFKNTENSKRMNVSRMTIHRVGTTFEGLTFPKGLSSIRKTSDYKPRSSQKDI